MTLYLDWSGVKRVAVDLSAFSVRLFSLVPIVQLVEVRLDQGFCLVIFFMGGMCLDVVSIGGKVNTWWRIGYV